MTWHAFVILGAIAGFVEVVAAIQNVPEMYEPEHDEAFLDRVEKARTKAKDRQ